jgi:hypothetical protein
VSTKFSFALVEAVWSAHNGRDYITHQPLRLEDYGQPRRVGGWEIDHKDNNPLNHTFVNLGPTLGTINAAKSNRYTVRQMRRRYGVKGGPRSFRSGSEKFAVLVSSDKPSALIDQIVFTRYTAYFG